MLGCLFCLGGQQVGEQTKRLNLESRSNDGQGHSIILTGNILPMKQCVKYEHNLSTTKKVMVNKSFSIKP